jgi:hypothetical protein
MPSTRPPTGPLPPPPMRSGLTATLPPPPIRDSSGRLPLPRAQTGRLPMPPSPEGSTGFKPSHEDEPMTGELPLSSAPSPAPEEAAAPASPSAASTPPPLTPPVFTPPPSFTPFTAPESPSEPPVSSAPEKPAARPAVPMPDFKPLFGYDTTGDEAEKPSDASSSLPDSSEKNDEGAGFDPANQPLEGTDLMDENDEPTNTSVQAEELQEKLELVTQERDQARAELEIARRKGPAASDDNLSADIATVSRERDEARMEVIVLRNRLEAAEQTQRDTDAMASQLEELSHVIDERDSVRRDYASLREQFETLKLDRSQLDSHEQNIALQEEVDQLRDQLAIHASDLVAKTGNLASPGAGSTAELNALKEQVRQAKEEASLAHRGLALSQKALQETREALREASEGTSTSKGTLEEVKKERAGLVRQNMLLQGQNDQLTRELSAAKAKLAAKGA